MTFDSELDCTIQTGLTTSDGILTGQIRVAATPEMYGPLEKLYDVFNEKLFGGALPGCLLTLQRERRNSYGYFSRKRWVSRAGTFADEIALNPNHFAVTPLLEALQTLCHEMVHQMQSLYGKPGRRGYHNKEFARMMAEVGLQASNTGKPGGKETGESMSDYPIAGGKFLQVVEDLLASGFTIAWMDRFPPVAIVQLAAANTAAPADLGDAASEALTLASLPLSADTLAKLSVQADPSQPPSAPTRTKYTCACMTNIWGKRGILATCGVCGSQFLPAKPTVADREDDKP
ncbi:SprT-like domain-containing protein [Cupriavidus basilensis]|uniref:SprT-like domain-containing protein n=1 Tax=Cupriavidus basilensis TaxID=68895 RepID=A0A643FWH9_9BURK|nr:SprT-like domain-containing protein [Cupriavidus basilensis]QOT82227.1 SprT-like domain-containing protein [Cupriavidus basilensis]